MKSAEVNTQELKTVMEKILTEIKKLNTTLTDIKKDLQKRDLPKTYQEEYNDDDLFITDLFNEEL